MTKYFSSDLHWRHNLPVRERGFGLPDGTVDHDSYEATIRENFSILTKDDRLYMLGDIAMNPKKGAFDFFDSLPCQVVLVSGNHDATAPFHSKAPQAQREWLAHFYSIHDSLQIKFPSGQRALASHYPYSGEGERPGEDRFTQYRLRDEGMPLLHGHTHSKGERINGNQFHVGLDANNLQLVREDEVMSWLDTLEG